MSPKLSLLALLAVQLLACAPNEPRAKPNVLFICLDTVRADHLGCYGYDLRPTTPSIDELAGRSIVFEHASATSDWTKPSVPSILTGLYPYQHGVYRGSTKSGEGHLSDVLPEDAETIAEVFAANGYSTAAFVKNAQLRKGQGIEQGFDRYVDRAGDAREIRWQALDWIDSESSQRPFFLYLHLLDAHWPYPVPDDYATRFATAESIAPFRQDDWKATRDRINSGELVLSSEQQAAMVALYDGSLRYIDDQLKLLFEGLELRGLAANTIITIVSDHGEEFLEHGRIGHGHGLYETLLHVPWILHVPQLEARLAPSPVSLVDVFPTVLRAAGIASQGLGPGVDRLSDPDGDAALLAEHLHRREYQQALRLGNAKLMRSVTHVEEPGKASSTEWQGRYRAKLRVDPRHGLVASDVEPRGDENEAPELKGPITSVAGDTLDINGIEVLLQASTERYGYEDASGEHPELAPGAMVKLRGVLDPSGVFVADRIKFYAPGTPVESELRGGLALSDDPDVLLLAGLPIYIEDPSAVQRHATSVERPFLREDVLDYLSQMAHDEPTDSFRTTAETYDLALDARELNSASLLDSRWETTANWFALRSLWTSHDQTQVESAALRELQAIGYAD